MPFGEPPKSPMYYPLYPPGWWGDAPTHPLPWVVPCPGRWGPSITITGNTTAYRWFYSQPDEDIPAMRPEGV